MTLGEFVIHWRRPLPEPCDECGRREWRRWLTPSFWCDSESAVSAMWKWALWWGPLHVRREYPAAGLTERLAAFNARTRKLGVEK